MLKYSELATGNFSYILWHKISLISLADSSQGQK